MKLKLILSLFLVLWNTTTISISSFNQHAENRLVVNISAPIEPAYKQYLKIPYKYGGNDSTGLDCSGLVKLLIKCPERHSLVIYKAHKDKHPLVYFESSRFRHIGYFISDTVMLHSTPGKGVHLTNINSNEYKYLARFKKVENF